VNQIERSRNLSATPAYVNDRLSDLAAGRHGSNSKSIIYSEGECDKSDSRKGDRSSCGHREVKGASIDSPFGPAETQSLTINCEWFPGHFAVVRRLDGTKSLSGEDHELQVLTYDRMAQGYFSYWFNNHGGFEYQFRITN
jgi:hypothetical protein